MSCPGPTHHIMLQPCSIAHLNTCTPRNLLLQSFEEIKLQHLFSTWAVQGIQCEASTHHLDQPSVCCRYPVKYTGKQYMFTLLLWTKLQRSRHPQPKLVVLARFAQYTLAVHDTSMSISHLFARPQAISGSGSVTSARCASIRMSACCLELSWPTHWLISSSWCTRSRPVRRALPVANSEKMHPVVTQISVQYQFKMIAAGRNINSRRLCSCEVATGRQHDIQCWMLCFYTILLWTTSTTSYCIAHLEPICPHQARTHSQ